MSEHLEIVNLSVDLSGYPIVRDVSIRLEKGQIASLLGPSGCGKTTLLRTIAGFEKPAKGHIRIRNQPVSDPSFVTPPEHRKIGMVFQDLALFPHLTIEGNVEFGIRQLSGSKRLARVKELLDLIGLSEYLKSYPHELSGGQQQRVALARAMAPKPDVLLLDEPFSGQDTERREQLSLEVRNILRHEGVTAMLVTHDQYEAFAFADVIGVLNKGKLHQWDKAFNLYHEPADRFVADFVGQGIFIPGKVRRSDQLATSLGLITGEMTTKFPNGTEVDLLVRPDDVLHDDLSDVTATIETKSFRGADHLYNLIFPGGTRVMCLAPSHHNHKIGEKIGVKLDMDHLVVFPRT